MSPKRPQPPLLELSVTKFRGDLSSWLTRISQGERLLLTVDRRPVAVLTDFGEYDNLSCIAERQAQAIEIARLAVS